MRRSWIVSGWLIALCTILSATAEGQGAGTVGCITTIGGGETRVTEVVVTSALFGAGSFQYTANGVGETTTLQPVTASFIFRNGGALVYFSLEGALTPLHNSVVIEGGRFNPNTLVGEGNRLVIPGAGPVSSTPITAQVALGPCPPTP